MFTVSPVIATPQVATTSFSAQAISAPDRVSLRLTSDAVSAPLQDERVDDNNPQTPARQALTPSQPQTQKESDSVTLSNDSAAFATQALSQENIDNTAALAAVAPFAPALQYNKLVSYGLVKYKPSDAGLSSSASPAPDNASSAPTSSSATTEYQAYNNTQLRNLSELTIATASSPVQITG